MDGESFFYYWSGAVLIIIASLTIYTYRTAQFLLDSWAKENGYTIIKKRYAYFWRGPFWWSASHQIVYRIEVQDKEGNVKRGWVRLTSFTWFSGKESSEEVWDKPK